MKQDKEKVFLECGFNVYILKFYEMLCQKCGWYNGKSKRLRK